MKQTKSKFYHPLVGRLQDVPNQGILGDPKLNLTGYFIQINKPQYIKRKGKDSGNGWCEHNYFSQAQLLSKCVLFDIMFKNS
jgi:hypothetical protein